jgi:hypothetical protein
MPSFSSWSKVPMSTMPLSTATPNRAMKPTPALMLKGMSRSMRRHTTDRAHGDGGEDQQGALHAVEGEEEQHEDEGERDGHGHHQAFAGACRFSKVPPKV